MKRHFHPKVIPEYAIPITQSWNQDNTYLYKVPTGMNDDWFWLYAAFRCRDSVLLVTNDEMRDHHFQMLSTLVFIKWKEIHQVHFTFHGKQALKENQSDGSSNVDDCSNRQVQLVYPKPYARMIQRTSDNKGIVIPMPKKGDVGRFLDGVYAVDDQEPIDETYLCICPND